LLYEPWLTICDNIKIVEDAITSLLNIQQMNAIEMVVLEQFQSDKKVSFYSKNGLKLLPNKNIRLYYAKQEIHKYILYLVLSL